MAMVFTWSKAPYKHPPVMKEYRPPKRLEDFTAPEEWTELCHRCKAVLARHERKTCPHGEYSGILLGGCEISRKKLEEALTEYCMICIPIARALEAEEKSAEFSPDDWNCMSVLYGSPRFVAHESTFRMLRTLGDVSSAKNIYHGRRVRLEVELHHLTEGESKWHTAFKNSYELEPAQRIQDLARKTLPSEHNFSPATFRRVRNWAKKCQLRHRGCSKAILQPPHWRPTRLLKLDGRHGELVVRLVVDTENVPVYATASYCWGTETDVLKLSRHNYVSFQDEIPMDRLPKTLHHVIEFAWNVGFEYIWIDSMCIIQDKDDPDWDKEAAMMGATYANGALNIAATVSEEANGSLIYTRDIRTVQPCSVVLDVPGAPTGRYLIYSLDLIRKSLAQRKINTRGWVFQERLLSPRTLHIGPDQFFWECRESLACETFPLMMPAPLTEGLVDAMPFQKSVLLPFLDGTKEAPETKNVRQTMRALHSVKQAFTPETRRIVTNEDLEKDPAMASVRLKWRELIEAYSACDFTEPMDRLVALQGIGGLVQEYLEDEFVAGMWKRSLPRELLWRRSAAFLSSTKQWRAPTWSWASKEGRIKFQSASRWDHFPAQVLSITTPTTKHHDVLLSQDLVLKVRSHVFSAGLLRGTSLVVEGHTLQKQQILLDLVDSDTGGPPSTVICVVLGLPSWYRQSAGYTDSYVRGIILQPVNTNRDYFSRIGYFECWVRWGEIFEFCKFKTVKIC